MCVYSVALGAQDFTDKMTILTNGRPHGMSPEVLAQIKAREIDIIGTKIKAHIGGKTDLLGLELEDGRELYFDGFFVDEGLQLCSSLRTPIKTCHRDTETQRKESEKVGKALSHRLTFSPSLFPFSASPCLCGPSFSELRTRKGG
jgi:hypothetical protein